jgi:hypothetical protein
MMILGLSGSIRNFTLRASGLVIAALYSGTVAPSIESAKVAVDKGDYARAISECKADASRGEARFQGRDQNVAGWRALARFGE